MRLACELEMTIKFDYGLFEDEFRDDTTIFIYSFLLILAKNFVSKVNVNYKK